MFVTSGGVRSVAYKSTHTVQGSSTFSPVYVTAGWLIIISKTPSVVDVYKLGNNIMYAASHNKQI